MRDAAGQLPEGIEFLGLAQLRLRRFDLMPILDFDRDVPRGPAISQKGAVGVEDRPATGAEMRESAFRQLGFIAHVLEWSAVLDLLQVRVPGIVVRLAQQIHPGPPDDVFRRKPERVIKTVREIGKTQVGPHLPKPVRGRFRKVLEALLALTQRPFGELAFGDVAHGADEQPLAAESNLADRELERHG